VGRIVFLTDRSPADALPAVAGLPALGGHSGPGFDVKVEALDPDAARHVRDLAPSAVLADAGQDPDRAFEVLTALAAARPRHPLVVVLSPEDLERRPWHDVADELLLREATPAEVRLRLAMLIRRTGGAGEAALRLGPVVINVESYQVTAAGRVLELTYKEFELLRFLVQHAGRVLTRGVLLQEVWGYGFYGGTRTVDVHVRRLRAKLGREHEGLIETVRGVGYRAAASEPSGDRSG
jgi:DNA-binding response OmpR family regulator